MTYQPRHASRSEFHRIRGLRYHVRCWGDPASPSLFLLHGWMDVSASFQFVVDALAEPWHVVAPDWRGFGLSDRASGEYWFPDYLADLDALLDLYSPATPALIVGHSMGGNIAGLYAGVRPARVSRLVLAEGFGLKATRPEQAPQRYARWLEQLREGASLRPYATLDAVAERLMKNNPRLRPEYARFLAQHWAIAGDDGQYHVAADPRHKLSNPVLYRLEEALACWRCIAAPVLWIWGEDDADVKRWSGDDPHDWDRRRAAFRQLSECTLRDAGHMMHHDQPEAFAATIEAFLLEAHRTSRP
jgi:pimeloyl-ACP methyl ester carboxylesterase